MDVVLTSTNQTIHLSSAGRAAVLAQYLTADPAQGAAIGAWVEQLVASAARLDIPLNSRDVRSYLPEPIATLEDIIKKSHPDALRGSGPALEPWAALLVERWCADARRCIETLVSVWLDAGAPRTVATAGDHGFPATLPLAPYQRMALEAYLQVGTDTVALLKSLLWLARRPSAPLVHSSLREADVRCCDTACDTLSGLFGVSQRWIGCRPDDRRGVLIAEHLRHAESVLSLLFEGSRDQVRRKVLADLLVRLSVMRREA